MEAKATVKNLRVSPQKARLVVDLIRGKSLDEALTVLNFTRKAVGRDISKVLRSAAANAENNFEMDVDSLFVKRAFVDQGPTMKRLQARAMGRGNVIRKKSSHVTIVLGERSASAEEKE